MVKARISSRMRMSPSVDDARDARFEFGCRATPPL